MAELEQQRPVEPTTPSMNYCPKHRYTTLHPRLSLAGTSQSEGARPTLGHNTLPVKFLSDVNSQTAWPLSTTLARSLSLALLWPATRAHLSHEDMRVEGGSSVRAQHMPWYIHRTRLQFFIRPCVRSCGSSVGQCTTTRLRS